MTRGVTGMAYWSREWRRMMERMMDMERLAREMMRELEEIHVDIYNSRLRELVEGSLEPLYQVFDQGYEIAIVVDVSGVDYDTVNVKVYEDHVEVEAEMKKEILESLHAKSTWSYHAARYKGAIALPARVDPSTARVEKKGSVVVIRVKKA